MAERRTQLSGVILVHILICITLCNGRPVTQDNQPGRPKFILHFCFRISFLQRKYFASSKASCFDISDETAEVQCMCLLVYWCFLSLFKNVVCVLPLKITFLKLIHREKTNTTLSVYFCTMVEQTHHQWLHPVAKLSLFFVFN